MSGDDRIVQLEAVLADTLLELLAARLTIASEFEDGTQVCYLERFAEYERAMAAYNLLPTDGQTYRMGVLRDTYLVPPEDYDIGDPA